MILVAHLEEKKMGKNLRVVYRLIYLSLTRKVQLTNFLNGQKQHFNFFFCEDKLYSTYRNIKLIQFTLFIMFN